MEQHILKDLLTRWMGGPGTTKGLTWDEQIAMIQALIDNEQIYQMDEGTRAFADVFQEEGLVHGYNCTKSDAEPDLRSQVV